MAEYRKYLEVPLRSMDDEFRKLNVDVRHYDAIEESKFALLLYLIERVNELEARLDELDKSGG